MRAFLLAFLILFAAVGMADAQNATKVTILGANGGAVGVTNGALNVNSSGGGGGGAVTIADGADVTQGAKADVVCPTSAGTCSVNSVLKNIATSLASLVAGLISPPLAVTGSTGADGSGTITTGGTAQNLFSAATPVNGFEVCNPDASEDIWISMSTTAAANATGAERVALNGGCYDSPSTFKPYHAVSIIAATTGHKFSATQW